MRKIISFYLATTAAAALLAPSTSIAQSPNSPALSTSVAQNDQRVLERLIERYKGDPSTYEDSVKWIRKNKPSMLKAFIARTKGFGESRAVEPKGGISSGLLLAGGAGVFGAIAAAMGSKKEKKNTPDDYFPEGVSGDPESFKSSEYLRSWGLAKINAAEKYAEGASGQGVKIAMYDTGIDIQNSEFEGRIDLENSMSFYDDKDDLAGKDNADHGTMVASIMMAAKDKKGMHGVAYDSEIVVFRGIGTSKDDVKLGGNTWSQSINGAIDAGAIVMNNSWAYIRGDKIISLTDYDTPEKIQRYFGGSVMKAFRRARDEDMLIVGSAGNDGGPDASVVAGIAAIMPEFEGHFISVVAVDNNNELAYFSTSCGIAANFCMAAPGVAVNAVSGEGRVSPYNGTSVAAPFVSGAVAVLKGQNPELTSPQISQILFETATDLGAPGVDPIYGHGLLNLGKARAPVGALMVYEGSSVDSGSMPLSGTGVSASSAMAPALISALSGRDLMVGDSYDRGYFLDASTIVAKSESKLPIPTMRSSASIGGGLSLISSSHGYGIEYDGTDVAYAMSVGGLAKTETRETLSPLSFMESEFGVSYQSEIGNGLALTAEITGAGGNKPHVGGTAGLKFEKDAISIHAKIGSLDESGTVLGSEFMGAAGKSGNSRTVFLEIENNFELSDDLRFSIAGTRSQTNFTQSGLITGGKNLEGSSGKIAISKDGFMGSNGTLTASISSPLQVTSGSVSIDMPSSRAASVDGKASSSVGREVATVDVGSVTRPYDLGFSYKSEVIKSEVEFMFNAGHRFAGSNSEPFVGFMISKRF